MAYSGCFSPHLGFCLRGDHSDGCGPFNEALPDWEHRDAHCHRPANNQGRPMQSEKGSATVPVARSASYLFSVLPASCRHNETIRDRTICRQDAGSTLGVTSKHS